VADPEGASGLILEHDVEDVAAHAEAAASQGSCLVPAINVVKPGLSARERAALAVGGGFAYAALGRRTGCLDAENTQVSAKVTAVRGERPDLPVCCAFGLSCPDDVSRVASECDGMIVGTAALRHLSHSLGCYRAWLKEMLAVT
jgi:tryptophan synthase alpha subunit